jgi:hypothetical protein
MDIRGTSAGNGLCPACASAPAVRVGNGFALPGETRGELEVKRGQRNQ